MGKLCQAEVTQPQETNHLDLGLGTGWPWGDSPSTSEINGVLAKDKAAAAPFRVLPRELLAGDGPYKTKCLHCILPKTQMA